MLNIEQELSDIPDSNIRTSYIISILSEYAKAHNQKATTDIQGINLYTPDGFGEIEGPVAFFILTNRNRYPIHAIINKIRRAQILTKEEPTIIFIISTETPKEIRFIIREAAHRTNQKKLQTPNTKYIQKIAEKLKEKLTSITQNPFSTHINLAKTKKPTKTETNLERLNTFIQQGNSVDLFLGAGVSCSAGMPGWNALLSKLLLEIYSSRESPWEELSNKDKNTFINAFIENDTMTPLSLARYLKAGYNKYNKQNTTEFAKSINKALYTEKNQTSPLLESITRACKEKSIRDTKRTKPKIQRIVTYNFDTLVEEHLNRNEIDNQPIYNNTPPQQEGLPIIHVHGLIPRDPNNITIEHQQSIVFADDAYNAAYNTPFLWSNLEQLESLRRSTCVMVGLSMNDPNMRRMLDAAYQARGAIDNETLPHFALLRRKKLEFEEDNQGKFDKKMKEQFLDNHHSIAESSFESLGVHVIWYNEHNELPKIIDKIFSPSTT